MFAAEGGLVVYGTMESMAMELPFWLPRETLQPGCRIATACDSLCCKRSRATVFGLKS